MSTTVENIESAIAQLSKSELSDLSVWFEEFLAEQWDRQIEADVNSGRLEEAAKRADSDFEEGRCSPL